MLVAMNQDFKGRFIAFLRLADHRPLVASERCGRLKVWVSLLARGPFLIISLCDVCHRFRVSSFFRPVFLSRKPQQMFHAVHYQFMLASVLIYME
jgi:hypothetical protein